MIRWIYAALVGIVGAGIVHILVLFLVPEFSERGPWQQLSLAAPEHVLVDLESDERFSGLDRDPLFRSVACRYDLDAGPTRLSATGRVPFWSVSIYDRYGQNSFSVNDRSAEGGAVDILLLTPLQMVQLQKDPLPDLARTIFVEIAPETGIAVIRAFVPDETWARVAKDFLETSTCERL